MQQESIKDIRKTIRFNHYDYKRLKKISDDHQISFSDLVRNAIHILLREYEQKREEV